MHYSLVKSLGYSSLFFLFLCNINILSSLSPHWAESSACICEDFNCSVRLLYSSFGCISEQYFLCRMAFFLFVSFVVCFANSEPFFPLSLFLILSSIFHLIVYITVKKILIVSVSVFDAGEYQTSCVPLSLVRTVYVCPVFVMSK